MPPTIAFVVTRRLATLAELQAVYGTQDLYDLVEIGMVSEANQAPPEK